MNAARSFEPRRREECDPSPAWRPCCGAFGFGRRFLGGEELSVVSEAGKEGRGEVVVAEGLVPRPG